MNITIFDDSSSEDDEHFLVHLINPRGGASVGIGGTVKVTIVNSDDAYGVIEFEPISLNVVVSEDETQPSTTTLRVRSLH